MERITMTNLEAVVARINRLTGSPLEPWGKDEVTGKHTANIGNYHLDGAYGGYALHRMVNGGGGVKDMFSGHYTKRELRDKMFAFITGLETADEIAKAARKWLVRDCHGSALSFTSSGRSIQVENGRADLFDTEAEARNAAKAGEETGATFEQV